jgi:aldehyde dehydrogenase (NAD+)
VLNIVSGDPGALGQTMAAHDDVAALWHFGGPQAVAEAEKASAGNLKPVWAPGALDWTGAQGQGAAFLESATRVKTIWVPYGA